MQRATFARLLAVILACFVLPEIGIAKNNRFSQINMVMSSPRQYEWDFDRKSNAIVLIIKNTSADDLKSLESYDERVIKRVLVKERSDAAVEVRFVLKDQDLRATIAHFYEPYRITLDIYDATYREDVDPVTGLPKVPDTSGATSSSIPHDEEHSSYQDNHFQEQELPSGRRFLVKPGDTKLGFVAEKATIDQAKPGVGASWQNYPVYIYRLQAATRIDDETQQDWMKSQLKEAESSPESMAEFAGRLFDFGHEHKAVEAYTQVLKNKPSLFQKAPLHMWRLAEAHLGLGNLSLADGYYAQFVSLFPQSKLHSLAQLRRLDIEAIKAVQTQSVDKFSLLKTRLQQLADQDDPEFQSLKAIRSAYWSAPTTNLTDREIPEITSKEYQPLQNALGGMESFKTQFLARSLVLYNMTHEDYPWQPSTGEFASDYFKRYREGGNQNYAEIIRDRLRQKLENTIKKRNQEKRYSEIIAIYESLPRALQSIRKTPIVAWSLGESYRRMGQEDQSIEFYATAAEGADTVANRFRASLWQGLLASRAYRGAAASRRKELGDSVKAADKRMKDAWDNLNPDERSTLTANLREPLELAIIEDNSLATPPRILLSNWENMSSGISVAEGKSASSEINGETLKNLSAAAKKFQKLGDEPSRQRAIALMKMMRPSQFSGDQTAKDLWSKELVALADEMRLADKLLDAGQLYVLVGSESENFPERAETLYKGGLLLYRAGRRDEAVEAFRKASEDGNNQFYANLARERLNRLSN